MDQKTFYFSWLQGISPFNNPTFVFLFLSLSVMGLEKFSHMSKNQHLQPQMGSKVLHLRYHTLQKAETPPEGKPSKDRGNSEVTAYDGILSSKNFCLKSFHRRETSQ
jgi:hypothetical protein